MVVVRFQRLGTKKTPHHRIVVTDRRRAQVSRVLEVVGFYNPSTNPVRFAIDESRLAYWVSLGAQVSKAVGQVLRQFRGSSASSTKH